VPPSDRAHSSEFLKWWDSIHFFLEWYEEGNGAYPCFRVNLMESDTITDALNNPDFYKLDLFKFDVENRGAHDRPRFNLLGQMSYEYVLYFKEVLEIRSVQDGYMFFFDLDKIGLPKNKYEEIMQVLNKYELVHIKELIFYIIAKAQDYYNEKVIHLESKECKDQIFNIEKEVSKAIDLIERTASDYYDGYELTKENEDILRINFVLANRTIQIKDTYLTSDIVKGFKKSYAEGYYKNWKLQLKLVPFSFQDDRRRLQFKYLYAIALYNFLTKAGHVKLKSEPYPNSLMECICRLLEFTLIKVGKPDSEIQEKIKTVRNWITKHELKESIVSQEINPDFQKLEKYFDYDFIHCVSETKKADVLKHGLSICLMFKIQPLQNEIIHIVACLQEWQWRVSQQLEGGSVYPGTIMPKDYDTLKLLLNSSITGNQLENITFKLKGDETIHTLSDKFPLYLIEAAINSRYKNFREDYESDILLSVIKNNDDGSHSNLPTGIFNIPEQRFLPKVINSFFNYLQSVSPQNESEHKPTESYYNLIANALYVTGFFRSQFPSSDEMINKVRYWHRLFNRV
jgi:hypothetical protein